MLEVEIKHDIDKNYLVVHGSNENTYMLKMLAGNSVKGFLDLEVRVLNNVNQYYYDITGKENLLQKSSRGKWTEEELRKAVSDVLGCLQKSKEYLLTPEHFVLEPQYMYRDMEHGEVYLCYAWNYEKNINEQLTELFAYFMNVVDYEDAGAVDLVYKLYDISREENCTLQRLWSALSVPKVKRVVIEEEKVVSDKTDEKSLQKTRKPLRLKKEVKKPTPKRRHKKNTKNVKEQEVKIEKNKEKEKPMWIKIMGIVALQLAILLIIFAGAKYGFFFENGGISYTKTGGTLLVLGVLDMYLMTKIFGVEEDETKLREIENAHTNKTKHVQQEKNTLLEKRQKTAPFILAKEAEENTQIPKVENLDGTIVLDYGKTVVDKRGTDLLNIKKKKICYLVPEQEDHAVISLGEFPFFIGRFQKDTGSLKEIRNISRMHSKIEQIGSSFFITDLNSTNGTFVNKKRLEKDKKMELYEGDEVTFANIPYHFTMQEV